MRLQMMTWAEVERHLETSRAVIVPIGSTEQHGPNGLIGTDALNADWIARAAGETAGAVVAPVINVGMAQHHMAFKGSMTLKPSTLILVIKEWVDSLAHHGFERFFFLNGHGGNIATINAAFQEIYTEQSLAGAGNAKGVSCRLHNWWQGQKTMAKIKQLYGAKDGRHATISEVSVTQYLFPDAVKTVGEEMGPPSDAKGGWADAEDYRRKFPDGRIGSHPHLATPEAGREIFEIAVSEIAESYRAFVEED
ncbi:MAG: creatininase family protein [Alphaproteobacteria bacterium]|jgi:creatinine amidohydrolase|nr:creatininase family protein [Alphaproteobacteria bacterium]